MMTEECGTETQLLSELTKLANAENNDAAKTCLRLIANHCIFHRKELSRATPHKVHKLEIKHD